MILVVSLLLFDVLTQSIDRISLSNVVGSLSLLETNTSSTLVAKVHFHGEIKN